MSEVIRTPQTQNRPRLHRLGAVLRTCFGLSAAFVCGCGVQPSRSRAPRGAEYAGPVRLVRCEVTILNPHVARDMEIVRKAAGLQTSSFKHGTFRWLPTAGGRELRTFEGLARTFDGPAHRSRLRACIPDPPDTSVRVFVLRLNVDRDGDVLQARLVTGSVQDPDITGCLVHQIMNCNLGRARDEATFDVPVVLVPMR